VYLVASTRLPTGICWDTQVTRWFSSERTVTGAVDALTVADRTAVAVTGAATGARAGRAAERAADIERGPEDEDVLLAECAVDFGPAPAVSPLSAEAMPEPVRTPNPRPVAAAAVPSQKRILMRLLPRWSNAQVIGLPASI
jgi:hypothetical protein